MRPWPRPEAFCTVIKFLLIPALGGLGSGCAVTPQGRSTLPQNAATSPGVTQINSALVVASLQSPASKTDYRLGAEDLLEITRCWARSEILASCS